MRSCVWIIGFLLMGASTLGHANDSPPAKLADGDGFSRFCGQWMEKLAARERSNLADAKTRSSAGAVVLEYTGYAKEPLSCESRVKAPGKPGVGVLVYLELKYRLTGNDREHARTNPPKVVEKVEITEVFRYDGTRWSY